VTVATRPEIPADRYAARLERVRGALRSAGAAGLLAGAGPELRYLTGYAAPLLERLTMLVVPADGRPTLLAPRLEAMRGEAAPAAAAGYAGVAAWDETDDPYALAIQALATRPEGMPGTRAGQPDSRVLVSGNLWATHVLELQRRLPDRAFGLAAEVLRHLRMAKDDDEVGLLRLAAEAADRALAGITAGPLVGRTEADVSREIRDRLVAEGHDEASFAIVGSGPNSASPHHEPGERRIQPGEAVVLDIGGMLGGYGSDVTRTIWVAGRDRQVDPDPAFTEIHELVRQANAAAVATVRPGVRCEAVDAAARDVITAAGHGAEFIHRVGHGIGLETHEDPYLVGGNVDRLVAGATFSIEPGIYLADRFGVRIEDIVACRDGDPEVLNALPRDAWVVDG
jgi:Xaa-Pro aminopeptidase